MFGFFFAEVLKSMEGGSGSALPASAGGSLSPGTPGLASGFPAAVTATRKMAAALPRALRRTLKVEEPLRSAAAAPSFAAN